MGKKVSQATWLFLGFAALYILSGCTTTHATRAFLYEHDARTPAVYSLMEKDGRLLSGNPIFLPKQKMFVLNIDEIRPGFIHFKELHIKKRDSVDSFEKPSPNDKDYSLPQEEFFKGRELWIIVQAFQLKSNDPLRLSPKIYTHTTHVHFDQESFGGIALSDDERKIMDIDTSSDYDIIFKVYEISGFTYDQILARAYNQYGIGSIATGVGKTVWETVKTLLGPSIVPTDDKGGIAIEQILLRAGARLELTGRLSINRFEPTSAAAGAVAIYPARQFLLYDVVKSDFTRDADKTCTQNFTYSYKDYSDAFEKNFLTKCGKVDLASREAWKYTFLRFNVKEP